MDPEIFSAEWFDKLGVRKNMAFTFGILSMTCGFCSEDKKNERCPFKKCLSDSEEFNKIFGELMDIEKMSAIR